MVCYIFVSFSSKGFVLNVTKLNTNIYFILSCFFKLSLEWI